jgi:hypothetical protein
MSPWLLTNGTVTTLCEFSFCSRLMKSSLTTSCRSRVPEVVSNEFHLRKAEDGTNAADVAKFFTEAQKEGKQIWYFTAPASIPIEVVEKLEIPLERAQKGQSILSHNGDDYGVAFEDAATSRAIKLLIPSKAGGQYHMRKFNCSWVLLTSF